MGRPSSPPPTSREFEVIMQEWHQKYSGGKNWSKAHPDEIDNPGITEPYYNPNDIVKPITK